MSTSCFRPHFGPSVASPACRSAITDPLGSLQLDPLGLRHAGLEALVDEQSPDLLERVVADELLDVDAAVPERRAFLVGLRDLRLEGDHALETRAEVVHAANASASPVACGGTPCRRARPDRPTVQSLARGPRVTLIPGDGTGPELTEATRARARGDRRRVRVGRPAGRRRRDGTSTAATRCRRDARVDPPQRRRAQGADHDADRRGLPLGQRRAAQQPRPLRAGAPVQDVPGRAHAATRTSTSCRAREHRGHLRRHRVRAGHAGRRGADRLARARTANRLPHADSGISIKPISITGTRRVFEFAFDYARRMGRRKVTAVHKANIMKFTDGLWLRDGARRRGREPRHRVRRPHRRQHVHAARPAARGVRRARAAEPLRRHRLRPRRRPDRRPRRRAGRELRRRASPCSSPRTARRRSTPARTRSTRSRSSSPGC